MSRKSPSMQLIEERHKACCNRPIEDLILTGLRRTRGEFDMLRKEWDLGNGTLNRWVDRLQIRDQVDGIRASFGISLTGDDEAPVLPDSINLSINGPCLTCHKELHELKPVHFLGVDGDNLERRILLLDSDNIRHAFEFMEPALT